MKEYLISHNLDCEPDLYLLGKSFLGRKENLVGYDVVFMDINMEETDGIETALQIRKFQSETVIVFVTAFINYVLEGYKVNAIRYIMKDTLETAIPECMDAVLHKMQLCQKTFVFIEGEKKLYTDNIVYVESRKHQVIFHYMETGPAEYHIYEKLDEIEKTFSGGSFLRIHKSYLVNMKHISRINNYIAVLDTGEELPVPRLRFREAKEAFVAYAQICFKVKPYINILLTLFLSGLIWVLASMTNGILGLLQASPGFIAYMGDTIWCSVLLCMMLLFAYYCKGKLNINSGARCLYFAVFPILSISVSVVLSVIIFNGWEAGEDMAGMVIAGTIGGKFHEINETVYCYFVFCFACCSL